MATNVDAMVQRYHRKDLYICTVLIASLASVTAGLSLEELSLEIKHLKENNEELSWQIRQLKQNDVSILQQETKQKYFLKDNFVARFHL